MTAAATQVLQDILHVFVEARLYILNITCACRNPKCGKKNRWNMADFGNSSRMKKIESRNKEKGKKKINH